MVIKSSELKRSFFQNQQLQYNLDDQLKKLTEYTKESKENLENILLDRQKLLVE